MKCMRYLENTEDKPQSRHETEVVMVFSSLIWLLEQEKRRLDFVHQELIESLGFAIAVISCE